MDKENCIRNKKIEEKLKEFYNYIAKRQMDDAVKIAKNKPKILGMGFRAIDIRAIEESIDCGGIKKDLYLLEEGQDNGVYISHLYRSDKDFILDRNLLNLESIYGEKITDKNWNTILEKVKSDFKKLKNDYTGLGACAPYGQ